MLEPEQREQAKIDESGEGAARGIAKGKNADARADHVAEKEGGPGGADEIRHRRERPGEHGCFPSGGWCVR